MSRCLVARGGSGGWRRARGCPRGGGARRGGNNRGARRRARRGIVVSRGGRRAGVTPRGGEGSRRGEGRRGGRRGRPGTGSSRAWGARGPGPRRPRPRSGGDSGDRRGGRRGRGGARRARAWRAGSVRANVSCPGGWETREPPRGERTLGTRARVFGRIPPRVSSSSSRPRRSPAPSSSPYFLPSLVSQLMRFPPDARAPDRPARRVSAWRSSWRKPYRRRCTR